MNKEIKIFHTKSIGTWGILETPCYPASWYFGPVNWYKDRYERTGEWMTGDNATSNFHRSLEEAIAVAKKHFPDLDFSK